MKVYVVQRYEDDLLIFATREAAKEFYRNDEFTREQCKDWAERARDLSTRYPDIPVYAEWAQIEDLFEYSLSLCEPEEIEVRS